MGAVIAQWICLRFQSCHPGFDSQAHHLRFYHLATVKFVLCLSLQSEKRTKINKKRLGFVYLKNIWQIKKASIYLKFLGRLLLGESVWSRFVSSRKYSSLSRPSNAPSSTVSMSHSLSSRLTRSLRPRNAFDRIYLMGFALNESLIRYLQFSTADVGTSVNAL